MATLVGTRDPARSEKIDYGSREQLLKLLLTCSLDSGLEFDLPAVLGADPSRLLPCYLGMLNRYLFLTPAAERHRNQLLGLGPLFEGATLEPQWLPSLAVAWMNCMYAHGESKHEVKRSLNRLAAGLAGVAPAPAAQPRRPLAERPVMLVLLEDFRTGHVNYRTFGPALRALRERFTLIAVAAATAIDEGAAGFFDRVQQIAAPKDRTGFAALMRELREIGADVAYYPTVGTDPWCIVAATQRLAPIQLATMGVPATTHSPAIDYVVIEESWAGDPQCYSETVVHTRAGSTRFIPRSETPIARPRAGSKPRRLPGALRVVVPALAPKLNSPFLETCARIAAAAPDPLEWHFFAGISGLQHAVAERQIRGHLPGAQVHLNLDYEPYLEALSACDLHLSTFPFGGMNTILDSLYLGLPVVTLEGREPHERSDAGMMRRAGLPEWLIAGNREQYVRTALRLISSPRERQEVRHALLASNLDAEFLVNADGAERDYLEAFCWIYVNHEHLRQSGRKAWTVAERG